MSIQSERKRRAGIFRSLSKALLELEEILDSDEGEYDFNHVRALVDVIDLRYEDFSKMNNVIYELLLQDPKVKDELVDEELNKADECLLRYSKAKNRVTKLINNDKVSVDSSKAYHSAYHGNSAPYQLPKIKFKQFNGDLSDWLPFWDQFKKIHSDEKIDDSDKMSYLLMSISNNSRAREVVDSFPATAEMYPEVIKALKQRFGRDDLLTEFYIREMLKIILQNTTTVKKLPLSMLYDKIQSHLRNLDTLGVTIDKCAPILLPLVSSSLPPDVLKAWERKGMASSADGSSSSKTVLTSMMDFVKCEIEGEQKIAMALSGFGLDKSSPTKVSDKKYNEDRHDIPTASGLLTTVKGSTKNCIFCSGSHRSHDCVKAHTMPLTDRRRAVEGNKACFCCLRIGHLAKFCRNRPKCAICQKSHHPIVCDNFSKPKVMDENGASPNTTKDHVQLEALASLSLPCKVQMQTLLVKIKGKHGDRLVRALLDSASQRSYVLEKTAVEMGYESNTSESIQHALFGGVSTNVTNHKVINILLSSLDGKYLCHFDALSYPKICNEISPVKMGPWLDELAKEGITVSDTKSDGPIEILIGADVAGRLLTGKHRVLDCGLVAIQTKLGWTLMGKIPENLNSQKTKGVAVMVTSLLTKDAKISDLWALDSLGIMDPNERLNKDELEYATHQHFLKTVSITEDGRFEVHLPWVENHPPLPSNWDLALKRLNATVRKLKNEGYYNAYQELLDEWAREGVIEEVTSNDQGYNCHYLPHRHIIKHASTTPVRPVFDASAHETKGPSLNQCLEKGPNYIEKIPSILARFRRNKIGIISDIRRAFLQISVTPADRDYLRFLWLDKNGILKIYRHCRVVFGLTSSPFHLAACLDLHLEGVLEECRNGRRKMPINLIEKLKSSFYVDNCLASLDSEEEVLEFIHVSRSIMQERMFDLRGWEVTTTEAVPPTNVLGLLWNRKLDTLSIDVSSLISMDVERVTKRIILSIAHRLFDPLGLTCCVSLILKQLLQQTWEKGIGWDQEVDEDIKKQFRLWYKEIYYLRDIQVPRWLTGCNVINSDCTLHIFSDASQKSYGTVAFIRVEDRQGNRVQLISAKARVSPVGKPSKKLTIPRLELLAASIASRMYKNIMEDYDFKNIKTFFWTDATTAIAWINREEPWDIFVYNRVKEIRKLTAGHQWRHLPGVMNPADLPSRGCSAKKLLESRWWEGPDWLRGPEETWPHGELSFDEEEINRERKKSVVSSMLCDNFPADWYYHRFSHYKMIIRMIGWIFRFINNTRTGKDQRTQQELTAKEYLAAENKVLLMVQNQDFNGVNDPKLKSLLPFVDESGLIRLMTKISYKNDVNDFCHPIVLPNHEHPVVFRLISDVHRDNCHAGLQVMMSKLRERFWILGGRRTVRSVLNLCVTCKRYSAKRIETLPVPLPDTRVRNAKVFEVCGVDLAGPLFLKTEDSTERKAYVCLFTCAVYRAVHLELISSQSTDSFLQGLRRFTSRRGRPNIIYSDCGTNFAGFENDCGGLDWLSIAQYSSARRIEWRFNPPTSPWWGGWWERLIGILKNLLRRVLGQSSVDYEEMQTILFDCEAIVNSRPLTYISQDPSDLTPLTPALFLMDVEEVGVPDFDLIEATHLRKRLRHRQHLREVLRQRFRSEYLGQLKLATNGLSAREISVGEIVLIGSDNNKRLDWPLARVIETIKGRDGHIRLVKVKTATGELLRPVQRLYPLELEFKPNEETNAVSRYLRQTVTQPQLTKAEDLKETTASSQDEKEEEPPTTTRSGRQVQRPKRLDI